MRQRQKGGVIGPVHVYIRYKNSVNLMDHLILIITSYFPLFYSSYKQPCASFYPSIWQSLLAVRHFPTPTTPTAIFAVSPFLLIISSSYTPRYALPSNPSSDTPSHNNIQPHTHYISAILYHSSSRSHYTCWALHHTDSSLEAQYH
jgi:hypothetical protein